MSSARLGAPARECRLQLARRELFGSSIYNVYRHSTYAIMLVSKVRSRGRAPDPVSVRKRMQRCSLYVLYRVSFGVLFWIIKCVDEHLFTRVPDEGRIRCYPMGVKGGIWTQAREREEVQQERAFDAARAAPAWERFES